MFDFKKKTAFFSSNSSLLREKPSLQFFFLINYKPSVILNGYENFAEIEQKRFFVSWN